jgi:hypothetical protein
VRTVEADLLPTVARIRAALAATDSYVHRNEFLGHDPYDALLSPLFTLPFLRSSHYVRLAAQQALKRLPVNLRPLLRIERHASPVTFAWMLEGYAHLWAIDTGRRDYYGEQIEKCLDRIDALRSPGYSGDCWGYEFDWEARYATIRAGVPNIVVTGIVSNALFEVQRHVGSSSARDSCVRSAEFLLHDLGRTTATDGSFCWSYSPDDRQVVLNATMKGARLCAQAYSLTGDVRLRDTARQTVAFVVDHQRSDGAWPYAIGDTRSWVDNFHTGYVLECLESYEHHARDDSFRSAKTRGWHYYRSRFLTKDYVPKYFDDALYPTDATACAQTISTLSTFGDVEAAACVASWTLASMSRRDGAFAYQRHALYKNHIPYLRWSVAPIFCALTRLLHAIEPPARRDKSGDRS